MSSKSSSIKILKVFLSCSKEKHLWKDWSKKKSLILCGDPTLEKNFYLSSGSEHNSPPILYVRSPDGYEDLPFKMVCGFNSILNIEELNSFTHFLKIDGYDTSCPDKSIDFLESLDPEYLNFSGRTIEPPPGIRTWHFGKVTKGSYWDNRPYGGPYTSWLDGGDSYILSRDSLKLISNFYSFKDYDEVSKSHIFEDLMIAMILNTHNIKPKQLSY